MNRKLTGEIKVTSPQQPGWAQNSDPSQFKGTSASGAITVRVDLIGRLKHIHIAPGTPRAGTEPWLQQEIHNAYAQAQRAAPFLGTDSSPVRDRIDRDASDRNRDRCHDRRQPGAT